MWAERLGKYELVRHLASGGMAHVFLARVCGAAGFTRYLVLKTMRPSDDDDPSIVSMFLDEARLVATLHHQHIAQVYELGITEDGTYFLAMEYLHGETVRAVLERARDTGARLPLEFSLAVAQATAAGLHHAHERHDLDGRHLGIVHRDVTPANILSGYDGSVKLIDFGIAKAIARATRTQTGYIKGKAGYMAPEQATGAPVDRRADVFSLGVVLYELTTQERAFPAATELEAAQRIARAEVVPPSIVHRGYPAILEEVVMTALARDPAQRFPDADVMGRAIGAAADALGVLPGPAAVARTMRRLFGRRAEPWYAGAAVAAVAAPPEVTEDRRAIDRDEPTTMQHAAPRKRPSWEVVPAAGALASVTPEVHADEHSTSRFMSFEVDHEPSIDVPAALAVGTWPNPHLAAQVEVGGGAPAEATLVEVTEISDLEQAETIDRQVVLPPRGAPPAPAAVPVPTPSGYPVVVRHAPTGRVVARPLTDPQQVRRRRLVVIALSVAISSAVLGALVSVVVGPPVAEAPPPPTAPSAPGTTAPTPSPPAPDPARSPASRPATASPSSPAPSRTAPTRSRTIAVRVTTDPPDATVLLDGDRLGRAPLTTVHRREPRTVVLKIRRRGYAPKKLQVSLDADLVQHVVLKRR